MALPVPVAEVRLREDSRVGVRSTARRSWDYLKTDFWVLLGVSALVCILASVALQFYITAFFLLGPVCAGGMLYFVRRIRGEEVSMEYLFEGFRRQFSPLAKVNLITILPLIPVVLVSLVAGFLYLTQSTTNPEDPAEVFSLVIYSTVLGLINLTWLSILMQFVCLGAMLCLEHHLTCRQTISLLWKTTKRHGGKIVLFSLVWFFFAFVGLFFFYVGTFVVWAWYSVANAYLYDDLYHVRHSLEQAEGNQTSATQ